jgi:hypothetical protein
VEFDIGDDSKTTENLISWFLRPDIGRIILLLAQLNFENLKMCLVA